MKLLLKTETGFWSRHLQAILLARRLRLHHWTGRKALNELLSEGKIQRIGKGVNRDPFRYFSGEKRP